MTLILALPVLDGIVIASDSQITSGLVRTTGDKLYKLNDHVVWGAAGELALIQRVEERIVPSLRMPTPLLQCRGRLAEAIKQSITELLSEDFRTAFCSANPDVLLTLHQGDFVFAELPVPGQAPPRVLHINVAGTAEWVERRAFATGSGELFAYALLQKYDLNQLDVQLAKVLAIKVIEEAIAVGAYGLGPPIQMYEITQLGAAQISRNEIAALTDTARVIQERERSLFRIPPQAVNPTPTDATSGPDPS